LSIRLDSMTVRRDSANILQSQFGYDLSTSLAVVATTILTLVGVGIAHRRRDGFNGLCQWWGRSFLLGENAYMVGFVLQLAVRVNPTNTRLANAVKNFSVTSPAELLVFNYIMFGRFMRNVFHGDTHHIKIFVLLANVVAYLLQVWGGVQLASDVLDVAGGSSVGVIVLPIFLVAYIFFVISVRFRPEQ